MRDKPPHFISLYYFLEGALGLFCLITPHFMTNYMLYTIKNTINEFFPCSLLRRKHVPQFVQGSRGTNLGQFLGSLTIVTSMRVPLHFRPDWSRGVSLGSLTNGYGNGSRDEASSVQHNPRDTITRSMLVQASKQYNQCSMVYIITSKAS